MAGIDWNFISELEGTSPQGYVPQEDEGDRVPSGVTIGSGFDLGQMSAEDLDNYNFSDELRARIEPYTGLTGDSAKAYLADNPLEVTEEEMEALESGVREVHTSKIVNEFNEYSDTPFEDLTPEQQTVIMSVGYQYGSLERTPTFRKHVTTGDWDNAEKELRNFGDDYKTRRNREADFLSKKTVGLTPGIIQQANQFGLPPEVLANRIAQIEQEENTGSYIPV